MAEFNRKLVLQMIAAVPIAEGNQISFAGFDLSGLDLSLVNLSDADLSDVNLEGADLRGADLDRAILNGVAFADSRAHAATLQGSFARPFAFVRAEALRDSLLRTCSPGPFDKLRAPHVLAALSAEGGPELRMTRMEGRSCGAR